MGRRGSVQVVEMSLVMPTVMTVVLALVYLSFAMFFHAYADCLARSTADELSCFVGDTGLYWQIKGEYIDGESLAKTNMGLTEKLKSVALLPGLRFESACSVTGKLRQPQAHVLIEARYFGKTVFRVEAEKDVYKPAEFADTVDFGHSVEKDFEELKAIYDAFF